MKGCKWLLFGPLLALSLAAEAELKLNPVHPDEAVAYTLNQRFSLANALSCLGTIRNSLQSFRDLTEAARGRIPAGILKKVGNTEWDIQTLGFANHPAAVEGALRYQNYLLKKALYGLAAAQARAGEGPAQKAEEARRELELAEREFQDFWDSLAIAD